MASFDWTEYLVLAKYLRDQNGSFANREGMLRSSISRSYYALYHVACRYITTFDKNVNLDLLGSDHATVRDHFRHHSNRDLQFIGENLRRLLRSRKQADYGLACQDYGAILFDAENSVGLAESGMAKFAAMFRRAGVP